MSFYYACVVFVFLLCLCWLFYSERLPFTNKRLMEDETYKYRILR